MTTLREWAPHEFAEQFTDLPSFRHADVEVVTEYGYGSDEKWKQWPGTHKNVQNWCVLANGYAVGWNENPSIGWYFPMVKIKDIKMTEELELINPRQYPHHNKVTLSVQENSDGDYPIDGDIDLFIEGGDNIMLITLNKDQVKQLKDWLDK
jgi:hypothetical protein